MKRGIYNRITADEIGNGFGIYSGTIKRLKPMSIISHKAGKRQSVALDQSSVFHQAGFQCGVRLY